MNFLKEFLFCAIVHLQFGLIFKMSFKLEKGEKDEEHL